MVLDRIRMSMREFWFGAHVRLFPVQPWNGWISKLKGFAQVLEWGADSDLFTDRCAAFPRCVPNEENVAWMVMTMAKNA